MLGYSPIGGSPVGAPLAANGGPRVYEVELLDGFSIAGEWPDFIVNYFDETVTELLRLGDPMLVAVGTRVDVGIELLDDAAARWGAIVVELLRIGEQIRPASIRHISLTELFRLSDTLRALVPVTVTDTIELVDTVTALQLLRIIERLGLSSTIVPVGVFGKTVAEQMRFGDELRKFLGAQVSETLELGGVLANLMRARVAVSETLEITADTTPRLLVRADVAETIDITSDVLLRMLWSAEVFEQVSVDIAYLAPGDGVTTWAMNTLTGAVSEYRNYAFDSFVEVDGRYLAGNGSGLYELLGDDDNGDAIAARLQGGFLQFGGTKQSRLKAVYIAMRGEGDVFLKIETGEGASYTYRVDTRNVRNTKVHMGKGQRARYFSYELVTVGQDFDLDTLEFVPVAMQRRV